ncbi:MAG: tRNA (adenosine(37)-N6)-threonylcarbamoyltransferase complex ATPase subunit type 1 TsaE [Phascolarctobacterium sp.]|nr:tRNA (adenosine(37)-N6)-threonylcarbamoyltransferase complex ATPase subunit type 1 TsaE [Phascolarctobacterium sp.]MCD8174683.1 tRNA (adenosine(37)-N6)-threonylcarbamoyltransferase complex ATPase subunit type 1 TsaE [Phascolarctobacterium sp.]
MEFSLKTEKDTENLGIILGKAAKNGDVFCFIGDLGAGKTVMCRGVAVALGVDEKDITSPTFTIMNIYQGRDFEIKHFDLYRIKRREELYDIGFQEYVGGSGITLIEWGDLFSDELPYEHLKVELAFENSFRRAILTPFGKRYEEILTGVKGDADVSD